MKKLLLYHYLFFYSIYCYGQDSFSYRVHNYTTENGLAHSSGNCFVQDEFGYIWIGSNSGLERFDGYEFAVFSQDAEDPHSLSSSSISALFVDKRQTLWAGTKGGGINRYSRVNNHFIKYFSQATAAEGLLSSDNVSFITQGPANKLWIGTHGGGLNLLDPDNNTNQIFNKDSKEESKLQSDHLSCYTFDQRGHLWIGELQGIDIIDTSTCQVRDYCSVKNDLSFFDDKVIRSIGTDSDGNIWIGIWVTGVYKYDVKNNTITFIHGLASNPEVYDIIPVSDSEMAIATNKGLYLVNIRNYHVTPLRHDQTNPNSLSNDYCISLYKDRSGVLWIGTMNSGINKINLSQKKFELYSCNKNKSNGLSDNFINGFEEDWFGNIWIATNKGLNEFVQEKNNFNTYYFLDKYNNEKVNTVTKGTYPVLWVGTDYGLIKYNLRSGQHIRYEYDGAVAPNCPTNGVVNNILYDSAEQKIWIGTWGGGLDQFDLRTQKWKNFPVDPDVFANNVVLVIKKGANDDLWLGTYGKGLVRFDQQKEKFYYYGQKENRSSNKVIICLLIDTFGKIWAGTGTEGVMVLDPEDSTFININTKNGLPSNEVAGILEKQAGEYWLSSAKGIIKLQVTFKKENDNLMIDSLRFNHFDIEDGLQSNAFNQQATLKSSSGKFYFGGNHGFNTFYPDSIHLNPFPATPIFTKLKIANNEIIPGEIFRKRIILEKPIYETDEITFRYNETFLGFEFSAMHFASPEKNKFAYQIENLHDEWIQVNANQRFISFSHLKPGDYTLKVKATNNDGVWNTQPTQLKIHILPPWWNTQWFRILLVVLLAISILSYIRYRTYKYKSHQKFLEDVIRQRTHEINEQKKDIQIQNEELSALNEEIISQSEQLYARNEDLHEAHEALKEAQNKLKTLNKNLDITVRERTAELEKTIKELDQFVYAASHDLGAPLKSILGLTSIIRYEFTDKSLNERLLMIESSIRKLENVIQSLKQFSRNSNLQVAHTEINLSELIREIIESLRFVNNFPYITFNLTIPKGLTIYSDLPRLKSIISNLIDNAIKYCDLQKPTPYINIDVAKKGKFYVLTISDNGQGIERSLIGNIFNMFYRANTRSEGSGLGLYIVKESLLKLGGEIKVKSILGKETTFIIKLLSGE